MFLIAGFTFLLRRDFISCAGAEFRRHFAIYLFSFSSVFSYLSFLLYIERYIYKHEESFQF
jgi:hypothetical protein